MAAEASWFIKKMENWAPPGIAEKWDNVGLLIGDEGQMVERVLVALDATDAVILEAIEGRYDWIITHHPLIFNPLNRITNADSTGRKILTLIQNRIGLYCAHTNLDMASGGVNDILFENLGLLEKQPLVEYERTYPAEGEYSLGCVGKLPQPMTLADFHQYVKNILKIKETRYAGLPETNIHTVALCAGDASAQRYWRVAVQKGCDVYITGDLRYHGVQEALESGLSMIDITHYAGEAPVVNAIVSRLRREAAMDGVIFNIQASDYDGQVFKC